jgi:hypothetical protein
MKSGDLKLSYLTVSNPAPNVYIGGLMVTDGRGLPVEFRYTEPIQPTKIQQVLYGQVLSAYIKREVILETLLKNVESKFRCLLVEDEQMLDYPAKGYAIVRIAVTKSAPLGAVGKIQETAPGEILVQLTPEGSPVRLYLGNPGKAKAASAASISPSSTSPVSPMDESVSSTMPSGNSGEMPSSEVISLLLEAGKSMDVSEPLRRIEKALEIICQEEGIQANSQTVAR